ncbi:MAG: hypothetical protein L3K15_04160 [Thermoplasmata archaeon]|nr:hypothetical protein [Thermoplasmata archaeon]
MVASSWTTYDSVIVLVTILVPAAMVGLLVAMTRSLKRRQMLQRGLAHIVFLPEKRRRFLIALTMLSTFFLASGAVDALTGVGLISGGLATVLSGTTFIGGAVSLFLLIITSLRPGTLTEDQKATLAWLPQQYYPLALGPIELADNG